MAPTTVREVMSPVAGHRPWWHCSNIRHFSAKCFGSSTPTGKYDLVMIAPKLHLTQPNHSVLARHSRNTHSQTISRTKTPSFYSSYKTKSSSKPPIGVRSTKAMKKLKYTPSTHHPPMLLLPAVSEMEMTQTIRRSPCHSSSHAKPPTSSPQMQPKKPAIASGVAYTLFSSLFGSVRVEARKSIPNFWPTRFVPTASMGSACYSIWELEWTNRPTRICLYA
ncbi:uncharacterized protein BO72DRAFT_241983 [Aspergillus fijiensis CBS 313.89]|uniref:Uncharacterized protein n=1 Tax=Aspergillus fijiensis CBS 313.89 TaxID=1448319 RepID=A0A8G1W373_9EURO|nr:uncharacterized protein BO72DRAFT_241983 [Aspergillus fijiensis CBS 313.89]RAK81241.1 hypothetical protein BO72DRAFT_241983 [Aspergillus fijiensis CBS 313.89]